MLEQLTFWTGKAMVAAWLAIGTIVGITPKDVRDAIAQGALERPLFEGPEGARKSAAFITAVAVMEGGFRKDAKGDCKDKPPGWPGCGKTDSRPTSFCFMQIHFGEGVERVGGYTPEELMADPLACVRTGREILRASITNKANKDEPLRSYAGTSAAARKRLDLAMRLFKTVEWPYRCEE